MVGPARRVAFSLIVIALPLGLLVTTGGGVASADPPLGNQTIAAVVGPDRAAVSESVFGNAVALGADGLTALVGDRNAQTATVYTRATTDDPWGAAVALTHVAVPNDQFGRQVALDGAGTNAFVEQYDTEAHAYTVVEYHFGGGTWGPATPVYVAPSGHAGGAPFAVSADGTMLAVRDSTASTVAIARFSGGSWQTGQTVSAGGFALAADASALAYSNSSGVFVARRSGTTFDLTSSHQLPNDGTFATPASAELAIAADGRTVAALGGSLAGYELDVWGATADGSWYLQDRAAIDGVTSSIGLDVALDGTGSRAFVGDASYTPGDASTDSAGRVVVFERAGTTWSAAGEITSVALHGGEFFGYRIASSADGRAALIGSLDMSDATAASAYSWETDAATPAVDPIARDDTVTTVEDQAVTFSVVGNDGGEIDIDADVPATTDAGGTLTNGGSGSSVHYTPPARFVGADTFTYTACDHDPTPACDTAVVTITVGPIVPFDTALTVPPLDTPGEPVVGDFRGDAHTDVYWYRPGYGGVLWVGGDGGMTAVATTDMTRQYTPVAGDFDGNGRTDILWYAPGNGREALWLTRHGGQFHPTAVPAMGGHFQAIVGDFDGDGRDDVFWYAPGTAREALWLGTSTGFRSAAAPSVGGTYTPVVGNFDGVAGDDIFWYAPGATREILWHGTAHGFTRATAPSVNATMTPVVGHLDGGAHAGILWYAEHGREVLWQGTGDGFATVAVPQIGAGYRPVAGDFDGDHRTDVLWYAPGTTAEILWQSTATTVRVVAPPAMDASRHTLVGRFVGSSSRDDVLWSRAGSPSMCWSGRVH